MSDDLTLLLSRKMASDHVDLTGIRLLLVSTETRNGGLREIANPQLAADRYTVVAIENVSLLVIDYGDLYAVFLDVSLEGCVFLGRQIRHDLAAFSFGSARAFDVLLRWEDEDGSLVEETPFVTL